MPKDSAPTEVMTLEAVRGEVGREWPLQIGEIIHTLFGLPYLPYSWKWQITPNERNPILEGPFFSTSVCHFDATRMEIDEG